MADKEIVDEGREKFSSRLGFILISAGCAIGLGNIWRFPYITGEYGGAAFVLLILFFLVVLGVPLLVMEFAMGRASYRSLARSYEALEPQGSKWHRFKWLGLVGCYLLMMFYTVVCGWTIAYFVKAAMGTFDGTEDVTMVFGSMLGNPMELTGWMLLVAVIGFGVCAMGVQKGVERITKVMMAALFVIMALLCVHSLTLEGGQAGLEFYLLPNFDNLFNNPNASFPQIVYAAMSQAMFMLSIGVGSMSIFGSYVTRDRKLTGEAVNVALLDALVAIMAGLSSSQLASLTASTLMPALVWCSLRCLRYSSRCPWVICGARCSSSLLQLQRFLRSLPCSRQFFASPWISGIFPASAQWQSTRRSWYCFPCRAYLATTSGRIFWCRASAMCSRWKTLSFPTISCQSVVCCLCCSAPLSAVGVGINSWQKPIVARALHSRSGRAYG